MPLVNKSCWLWVLYGPLHCVQWKVSSSFPSCTWLEHKMCPVISVERCWNAHRNAPQHVCWHLWSGSSDVNKDILLGFSRFRERFCRVFYYLNIISIELGSNGAAIYPLLPIMGTMRYFCPVDCGVYSVRNCLKLAQLCLPNRHSRENCCKTKTHQSTKGFEWTAELQIIPPPSSKTV